MKLEVEIQSAKKYKDKVLEQEARIIELEAEVKKLKKGKNND